VKPQSKIVPPAFDFSQQSSGLAGFGTGFGLEGVGQLNQNTKSFATMSGGVNKGFDMGSLDFSLTSNQEPVNAFSKKTVQEGAYGPMDQVFASQIPEGIAQGSAPNMNPGPNINDFNTMQHLFATNFGNAQDFNFAQPQTQSQIQQQKQESFGTGQLPAQFTSTQQFQGNSEDFSTSMMRMFQSSSPQNPPLSQMNLNVSSPVEPVVEKQVQPNPLDMFSNNKPSSFATLSGGNFQHNFDMANFGTMQANTKGNLDLNFFDAKPAQKTSVVPPAGDLI
jgi:hypothetical protein